jgi:hypothetical protein
MSTLPKIEVVAETLNPKNIKIAQREALMWEPINRSQSSMETWCTKFIFVKTKEDVDLAVESIESGLINFGQKIGVSNDSGYCQS